MVNASFKEAYQRYNFNCYLQFKAVKAWLPDLINRAELKKLDRQKLRQQSMKMMHPLLSRGGESARVVMARL